MRTLCVFCGSSSGHAPVFREAALQLADTLLQQDVTLVYGGGNVGLMGVLAQAMLDGSGSVIGVIPEHLRQREVALETVSELIVTADMHSRKAEMARLSDGFLALPGGLGTFEELFEMLTWTQLGLQDKPCALLNVAGFYDGLLQQVEHASQCGFIHPAFAAMLLAGEQPEALLQAMRHWRRPAVDKAEEALRKG